MCEHAQPAWGPLTDHVPVSIGALGVQGLGFLSGTGEATLKDTVLKALKVIQNKAADFAAELEREQSCGDQATNPFKDVTELVNALSGVVTGSLAARSDLGPADFAFDAGAQSSCVLEVMQIVSRFASLCSSSTALGTTHVDIVLYLLSTVLKDTDEAAKLMPWDEKNGGFKCPDQAHFQSRAAQAVSSFSLVYRGSSTKRGRDGRQGGWPGGALGRAPPLSVQPCGVRARR